MNKLLFLLMVVLSLCTTSRAQEPPARVLYVIDSVPLLHDPEEWNQLSPEDVADVHTLRDKDSLRLLGWEQMDAITYIFTLGYRSRPDSLRRVPSLRQMVMIGGAWHLNGVPYSGKYIDYYNSGRIMNEGVLLNGKLNGELVVYFKNGNPKSIAAYRDGKQNGDKKDFYKNGALLHGRTFSDGKEDRGGKTYFINGQVEDELRMKRATDYDTAVSYYSTGRVKKMTLLKNTMPLRDKKREETIYYSTMFNFALQSGDLKTANNHFFKLWMLDSTSTDTYFMEGRLLLKEQRFDDALAAFDRALAVEPLMRESLVHRALTRLYQYRALKAKGATGGSSERLDDAALMASMPPHEQELICRDVQLAEAIDPSELYVNHMISVAVLTYCDERGPLPAYAIPKSGTQQ